MPKRMSLVSTAFALGRSRQYSASGANLLRLHGRATGVHSPGAARAWICGDEEDGRALGREEPRRLRAGECRATKQSNNRDDDGRDWPDCLDS